MTEKIDIALYDSIGMPPDTGRPLGGSEMNLVLLTDALTDLMPVLRVRLLDRHDTREIRTRVLLLQRYSPLPRHVIADRVVVMAHDLPDERYEQHRGREIVCVSDYQREVFERWAFGRCRVIRPILGAHVKRTPTYFKREFVRNRWIYASAAAKGLAETLLAWSHLERDGELLVTTSGYDEPDVKWWPAGARWIGRLNPEDIVGQIGLCEGMLYRNARAECFPMVVAIARALGLTLDVSCVGHDRCGVQEAMQAHDLSPVTIAAQWVEFLFGGGQ